jgi:hypothetical protein
MEQSGIFCLEGDWWNDYTRPTSVEHGFALLKSAQHIRYIHRDVATTEEFSFYLDKWLLKKHGSYPILYLAFHGEEGLLRVGDQRRSGAALDFHWFEQQIAGRGRGRMLYFGSCSTMNIPGRSLDAFLKNTRLEGVLGYRGDIDWADSMTMDIFLLSRLAMRRLTARSIEDAYAQAQRRMRGLSRELSLAIKVRKARAQGRRP